MHAYEMAYGRCTLTTPVSCTLGRYTYEIHVYEMHAYEMHA